MGGHTMRVGLTVERSLSAVAIVRLGGAGVNGALTKRSAHDPMTEEPACSTGADHGRILRPVRTHRGGELPNAGDAVSRQGEDGGRHRSRRPDRLRPPQRRAR